MHEGGRVSRNHRSRVRALKRGPTRRPQAGPTADPTERRINQSAKVRNALENLIAEGSLAPGSRLDEETLASQFGVSRTPVREALLQLASTGLVESRPRQSAMVATLSVSAIIESFEFNVELESITARMAARRMTLEERATLDSLVKRMRRVVEQKDVDQYVVLNRDFHEKLYAASHNRYVHAQARSIFARLAPYRRQVLLRPGQLDVSQQQHERIAAAVLTGDAETADQAMREHTSLNDGSFLDVIGTIARGHDK
jgi:DNA-binding GntR family transcriptional regulator